MTDQLDQASAQRDLETARAMGLAARQRTVWPRWAAAIDAVGLGAMMTLFMLFAILFPDKQASVFLIYGMLGIIFPSLWFRFHMLKRLGAMARPGWSDLGWNLLYWVWVGAGVAAVRLGGPDWTPYAIGVVLAVMHYVLRRHGRVV